MFLPSLPAATFTTSIISVVRPFAVAIFFKDERFSLLRLAKPRGMPHTSISSGVHEIAPEVST